MTDETRHERILITGATGFLGGALCSALFKAGRTIVATGRDAVSLAALSSNNFDTIALDLAEPFSAETLLTSQGVTTIVHCAALSSPWGRRADFDRANVIATTNLVSVAKQIGVSRFVLISSPTVYFQFEDQLNINEQATLPSPVNDYARTKREAELAVLAAPEIGPIILRPRGIYGEGDTSLLPRLVRVARAGPLPLFRGGVAQTDITHVEDVVSAIIAALDAPAALNGEIFNISSGEPLPLSAIVERACASAGVVPRWQAMPVQPALIAARFLETVCRFMPGYPEPRVTTYSLGILAYSQTLDITKAAQMLNWKPRVNFDKGIARTFVARSNST
jgi:nucleoside-diphosphate-sugar epimerase